MPRFHFRLAPVLRFREQVKRQKQSELAQLNRRQFELQSEIESLERDCDSEVFTSDEGTETVWSAEEIRVHADYVASLLLRLKYKRAALAELENRVAQKRQEVVEAVRAVKALEQLRARAAEKFWHDLQITEQKATDEIGLRKFIE